MVGGGFLDLQGIFVTQGGSSFPLGLFSMPHMEVLDKAFKHGVEIVRLTIDSNSGSVCILN